MYKQSIVLFGIVLPLIVVIALVAGLYMLKSNMAESFAIKTDRYKTYSQSRNTMVETEKKIATQREHVARWRRELAQETTSTLRTNLKLISEKVPSKEFQETSFDPLTGTSGFGAITTQKSSQFRLGLRGTYRSIERVLLELETRMPQLQCQDLKIETSNQSVLLNFQITYTAWEN